MKQQHQQLLEEIEAAIAKRPQRRLKEEKGPARQLKEDVEAAIAKGPDQPLSTIVETLVKRRGADAAFARYCIERHVRRTAKKVLKAQRKALRMQQLATMLGKES